MAVGVADGVGGWSDHGIDPSIWSQSLMYYAQFHSANAPPAECLQLAYDSALADDQVDVGKTFA